MVTSLKFKVPGFAYPGGKVKLRKWLVSMMPRSGGTYVEPFAGRGNVFWLAACCLKFEKWWLNDPWTDKFLRAITSVDLSDIPIAIHPNIANRLGHLARSDHPTDVALVLAPRIIFAGGCRTGGRKSIRTSRRSLKAFNSRAYKQNVRNARRILKIKTPKITNRDWLSLGLNDLCEDDFCYLDPPYYQNQAGYSVDTVDHQEFLKVIQTFRCRWLLSGYDSELYRGWLGEPFAMRTVCFLQSRLHGKSERVTRIECVWRNY